jgi:hypothetical protein
MNAEDYSKCSRGMHLHVCKCACYEISFLAELGVQSRTDKHLLHVP